MVLVPLILASKWGAIGAKTQLGYGVIELEGDSKIEFNEFENALKFINEEPRLSQLNINLRDGSPSHFPKLTEMFFTKIQFKA
ncbi:MAG: type III-B CRISPR module RAMP protein Cmr1, partial [Promethearchaeota archaeon]